MKYRYSLLVAFLSAILYGCSDDSLYQSVADLELDPGTEAYLSLTVNDFTVSSMGTRDENDTPEPELDEEKTIKDLWILQFKDDAAGTLQTGELLVRPQYYTIHNQEELQNLKVLLKEGVSSKICVVANTHDPNWAKGSNFNTYDTFKSQGIPNPKCILFSKLDQNPLPMEGSVGGVTVSAGSKVNIDVYRMYAKLKIYFGTLNDGVSPSSISIDNIPYYCRVKTLGEDLAETQAYKYADISNLKWDTQPLTVQPSQNSTSSDPTYYVLYVPENLQGETDNPGDREKKEGAPKHALVVKVGLKYVKNGAEQTLSYSVYPGKNDYNNFNIRRNCVYRVKINVLDPSQMYSPSSNCLVVATNTLYSFEPYYREETGGIEQTATEAENSIFRFNTYLDPNDYDSKGNPGDKAIDRVQILWQTKDAIGDNRTGDKVWIEDDPDGSKGIHRKIYVKTQSEGNALIGALNSKNEIIWSWHIWVTDKHPDDPNKGVVYNTYDWIGDAIEGGKKTPGKILSYQQGLDDNTTYTRKPGRRVMMCNLGALDFEPAGTDGPTISRTFGMVYQWGRKDPFPPLISFAYGEHTYDNNSTGYHYDYTNEKLIAKTNDDISSIDNGKISQTLEDGSKFPVAKFSSLSGNNSKLLSDQIKTAINYPYLFMCGTPGTTGGSGGYGAYCFSGDWLKDGAHNDKLWGGTKPEESQKSLELYTGVHIYDNYGNKTIFDPCPTGWRVPPGDLWLGFSKTGLNPGSLDNVNYDVTATNATNYGMYMYMDKSKWEGGTPGETLFFPTQGTRVGSGRGFRCGQCGNYSNATTDIGNRVNTLHIHKSGSVFKIFEVGGNYFYYIKSTAGPVRCVRDTNN